jgi:beta-lactamase regulating signal transducer with metallopeptidase domain
MNPLIETLNLWGDRFLQFAGPMFWQSSLLIVVLFALDFALRRKVRAIVRYTLWLVVLVKLLLPPTLALPTGVAWWLRPAPATAKPETRQVIVTYGKTIAPPSVPTIPLPPMPAPPVKLSRAGGAIIASVVISLGLLAWMFFRWRQVSQLVRATTPATEALNELLDDSRRSIGLRRVVRLRLTDLPMSPAVCGLLRPVILLPRALAEQLPPNQLRAVLLHELVHLNRGDLWVNCAQVLLQIAYWWNPLLWLANARIRRIREEAVDDAVMLALRDDAETYAPTLLEVAKLAFHRPLASLGLVGIMESRSALRQRIERIVHFKMPGKTGFSAVSLLGIAAFTALAVPMGETPNKSPQPSPRLAANANEKPTGDLGRPQRAVPQALETLKRTPTANADNSTNLYVRRYKVDPNTFYKGLESASPLPIARTNAGAVVRDFFISLGVELNPPKSIYFNDRAGELLVRATLQDLDTIESAIQTLNATVPQVNIKVRFVEIEVGKDKSNDNFEWFLANVFLTNRAPHNATGQIGSQFSGILTDPQYRAVLSALGQRKDANVLAEQEVTTLSGRQAQIATVELRTVVNGMNLTVPIPPGTVSTNTPLNSPYQTLTLPFGPTLDVIPFVSADGYTVQMTVIPTVTEFLGYDDPSKVFPSPRSGRKDDTVLPLPRYRIRQVTTSATVWDGQTLVLGCSSDQTISKQADGSVETKDFSDKERKQLLIFVTPTIIDQAGNRVHTDDEMPPGGQTVPPQKPAK